MWRSLLGMVDVEFLVGNEGCGDPCWEWRLRNSLLGMRMWKSLLGTEDVEILVGNGGCGVPC